MAAQFDYYVNEKVANQRSSLVNAQKNGENYGVVGPAGGSAGAVDSSLDSPGSFGSSAYDQHFNRAFIDGDYSFVSTFKEFISTAIISNSSFQRAKTLLIWLIIYSSLFIYFFFFCLQLADLPTEELLRRKSNLDAEMDIELRELQSRYQTKRQPILDAIKNKKTNSTRF